MMEANHIYRRLKLILAVLALSSTMVGVGYNYRGLAQAREDIERLKQAQPVTKSDLDKAVEKLERRLERIENILMQQK
jgi:hypothetical protein